MRVLVRFAPPSLTTAQYEEVKAAVAAAAGFPPDGMEMHLCFGPEGARRVTEIWSSPDAFAAFGERLMPALAAAGVGMPEPEVLPVHRMLIGDEPMPGDDTGLVVRFRPPAMTLAQYEHVTGRLREEHLFPAEGARVHVLSGEPGRLQVGGVWASEEDFDAFAGHLRPLMEDAGLSYVPERFPLHAALVTDEARRHATA